MTTTTARAAQAGAPDDERAIAALIERWLAASEANDLPQVLELMADDVVFMVPGRAPFGKKEFAATAGARPGTRMQAQGEVEEVSVHGDWAWCRTRLAVVMTTPDGRSSRRSGRVLSILRKQDGRWLLARDANMLAPE